MKTRYIILLFALLVAHTVFSKEKKRPNVIFILADDMGYADLGCYGADKIKTPVIDNLAKEGMRFTSFNTQPVCSPTRTAILTGCYPMRVAEYDNIKRHHPFVHLNEILIPELLKPAGYRSAAIGKWDLNGHKKEYTNGITPNDFGFDYSYGRPSWGDIYENGEFVEKVNFSQLTQLYTAKTLSFIEKHKDSPFFIYLAHTMPHVPLDASEQFKGKSEEGIYGDVIEELDWSTGQILAKLKELQLDNNTIVIFTSDNGPWPDWTGEDKSGSAGPLRGQKTETWEGGVRVPFIVSGPGISRGNVCDELIGDVDMLPTIASFAGVDIPTDRIIDGKNLVPLMTGKTKKTPVKERYFYYDSHLQAVRSGRWKLILPRPKCPQWLSDQGEKKNWRGSDVEEIKRPELYDLENDMGETKNVSLMHPEVVKKLQKLASKVRKDIGDYNQLGKGARFYEEGVKRPDIENWKNIKTW